MKRSPGWLTIQQYKWLILVALPFILTPSCAFVFKWAAATYGSKLGYFIGFLFYWLFWCILFPIQLIGSRTILQYYSFKRQVFSQQVVACLLAPLIFVYVYAFPSALQHADTAIVVLSFLISLFNATAEEVLW